MDRALSLLAAYQEGDRSLTLNDLAARTGLVKSTVLRLLASELSQREIGSELYVSFNTVKAHTRSIFRKLGASNRAEAVARGRELGLD